MGLQKPLTGEPWFAVGHQQGLAHRIECRFDRIGGGGAPFTHPTQDLLHVAGAPSDALGEERRDRQSGGGVMRLRKHMGPRRLRKNAFAARNGFNARDRATHAVSQTVGELVHLGDQLDVLERGNRAERRLVRRIGGSRSLVGLQRARLVAGVFGDQRGGERAEHCVLRGGARTPGLQRAAHLRRSPSASGHFQAHSTCTGSAIGRRVECRFDIAWRRGGRQQSAHADQGGRLRRAGGAPHPDAHLFVAFVVRARGGTL
jgi:hypothetical protein